MPCSEKNSTQTELAEYLFLTPQTVSRWEVGSGALMVPNRKPVRSIVTVPSPARQAAA